MPTHAADSTITVTLTPKQVDWLRLVTGDDVAQWPARQQAREDKLADLRARVAAVKGRLDASFDYKLQGKDRFLWFKHSDISSKDDEQDSMRELDVVHDDLSRVGGIKDEDAFGVALAYEELEKLQEELLGAVDPSGELLFTDEDVMRELYTPLVREGVMSENQVPDKYSEVANVFNQSAEMYNRRLEEFSASRSSTDDFKDTLRFTSGLISDAQGIAAPITELLGAKQAGTIIKGVAIGLQAGIKVTEHVVDRALLDGIDTVASATGDIIALFVSKELGKLVKKGISAGTAGTRAIRCVQEGDYAGALGAIGDGVTAATEAADPKGENGAKDIGSCVAAGFTQAGNLGTFITAVQSKDPAKISAALGEIAKSSVSYYTDTLKVDKSEDDLTEEDKRKNAAIDGLTETINSSIDLGAAATKTTQGIAQGDIDMTLEGIGEVGKASVGIVGGDKKHRSAEDDFDSTVTLTQNLTDVATNAAKALVAQIQGDRAKMVTDLAAMGQSMRDTAIDMLTEQLDAQLDAATDEETKEELEAAKEELEEIKEEALVLEENMSIITAGLDITPPDPEALKLASESMDKIDKESNNEEIEQARREFRSMLELSVGGMDPEMDPEARKLLADQFDIDKLIQQMQMDQAVLAAAESIFNAGRDIAVVVVPQIAAMQAGQDFLKNVVVAAERAIELNRFLSSLNDASSAVSAYADAIKKRVDDTSIQLTQHTIEAILDAARAVGAALASTGAGPIAGAGVVIQKTAEASKGLKSLLTRIATEAQLDNAWKLYRRALENPLDRKLKRMAMASNPTLSKYAIAYGAYVQGDIIATDMVRKCGLTEEVLANPSTNVDKVVKYLEVRFSEDQVLLRTVSTPLKWLGGKTPELSTASWMEVKSLAVSKAKLVVGGGENSIERYLLALDATAYRSAPLDEPPTLEAASAYADALNAIMGALKSYRPVNASGDAHEDMMAVREDLLALAGQEMRLAAATIKQSD